MTRPNTISFSFRSGIGAVVMKRSNTLLKYFPFDVPSMNASCFILVNNHNVHQLENYATSRSLLSLCMNISET